MATILRSANLDCSAAQAWRVLRDVGHADDAFPGVLTGSTMEGDVRTVVFANGFVARERIHGVCDDQRRIDYSVISGPFTEHKAYMQVVPQGDRCRFDWVSEFEPDMLATSIEPLVDQGVAAIRRRFARAEAVG
ncbi:MAG TPA: SRPBCC family protein [Nevskiaceae bacterium]|nr:SRPBCC family protein [Nevskiaceae bacterium]